MIDKKEFNPSDYITISKNKFWTLLIAYSLPLMAGFVYMVRKDSLTWDNQVQKIETIKTVDDHDHRIVKLEEQSAERDRKQIVFAQIQLQILRAQEEMKKDNKENFSKVGQDLEQIKNLSRKR